jgi:uncharacterized protein (DUF1501 family)
MPNIITRRSFLSNTGRAAVGLGLASLMNIPPFLRRALAEGNIGLNGKKLIFIFLRGGNDGVNNVIPILDPSYRGTANANRSFLAMPMDPNSAVDYAAVTGQADIVPIDYPYAVRLGNGFAALNPALRDLAPIFNAGDAAIIQRAGYRSLSRSHFDSEQYWEKGTDGTTAGKSVASGIWYRTVVESGWNLNHALSGVSIQSNMPASLRGEQPMTNLSSLNRYKLLGVYNAAGTTNSDSAKILNALDAAYLQPFPTKDNREMVHRLGVQFRDTLDILQNPAFQSNTWVDENGTYPDGTYLFPATQAQDTIAGISPIPGVTPTTYRVGSGGYSFMNQIRNCAQMLNNTDSIIAGTEIGGFDTHTSQVTIYTDANNQMQSRPHLGSHANILRRVAAAYYGLWRYFTLYGKGGPHAVTNPSDPLYSRVSWDDVVVVTMSEFGRTSIENDSTGTDHGESSVMYVAGGGVNGAVYGCDLSNNAKLGGPNWAIGNGGKNGALYSADTNVGYLRRTIDYRSVLGEIIRDHLGATPEQLNRIIPAYGRESTEHLLNGGMVATTPIIGELGII